MEVITVVIHMYNPSSAAPSLFDRPAPSKQNHFWDSPSAALRPRPTSSAVDKGCQVVDPHNDDTSS